MLKAIVASDIARLKRLTQTIDRSAVPHHRVVGGLGRGTVALFVAEPASVAGVVA